MEPILCPWEPSTYLFFSSNVPALIHYSHIVAIISALAIGSVIYINNPKSAVSRLILLFVGLFSVWASLDVILWATNSPSTVMFAWSLQVLIEPLTYAVAFYIFYIFIRKSWPRFTINLFISLLLLPVIILLPTNLNLEGLLLSTCESIEGPIAKYYTYSAHILLILMIVALAAKHIPRMETRRERVIAWCFGIGLLTFLLSFTSGNLISSFTDDWTISQYGLFGMPFFASLIAYSIVKFKAFNTKTFATQVLVIILAAAVLSLIALQEIQTVRIVALLTFILVCTLGYVLIRSVKKEIEQRRRIEELAQNLEAANERLKVLDKMKSEFVSIASHQLRSPLTAIRGYASMLLEGSYGKIPKKAEDAIKRIADSSRHMSHSVEDYLNVSRIEAGNMKYEISDFNLKDITEGIVDEMRNAAADQELTLVFKSECPTDCLVRADIGKTRQVIQNLIDNAMKYTKAGTITVTVKDDSAAKKLHITVADTGVGMSEETQKEVFNKFIRAKNANEVNVTGTGLGLFVAKKMTEEMGGRIWAESEGEGKGSTFHVELPLTPEESKKTS